MTRQKRMPPRNPAPRDPAVPTGREVLAGCLGWLVLIAGAAGLVWLFWTVATARLGWHG